MGVIVKNKIAHFYGPQCILMSNLMTINPLILISAKDSIASHPQKLNMTG